MPLVLLTMFSVAVTTGAALLVFVLRLIKHNRRARSANHWKTPVVLELPNHTFCARRPTAWLAIKSKNPKEVQTALGLHNPKPCSWNDGLEQSLFIAPPVQGWILVLGSGLPDPSDDIDVFFRFLLELSRKLGHVQFFHASPILHHHAWAKADRGRVIRAYAWAGRTLWRQGDMTTAEIDLDVRCFDYSDSPPALGQPEVFAVNVDKVPLLAGRWSVDPGLINEHLLQQAKGIAGDTSRSY
jgi:hypothetical protein